MEVRPLADYRAPGYPEKRIVLDNPELLRTLPQRWKNNAWALAALSALLAMTFTGCMPLPDMKSGPASGGITDTDDTGDTNNTKNTGDTPGITTAGNTDTPVEKIGLTAPIFEHGGGRGAFGCVSVAPPAFLSEEEALDVIRTEAESMGIDFANGSLTLQKVGIPGTKYYLFDGEKVDSTKKGELVLDGFDPDKKVGIEFISRQDYDNWHKEEGMAASVQVYDFLSTARLLRDGVDGKTKDASVGILYDPMPVLEEKLIFDEETSFEEKEAILKEQAVSLLREQVRDFLEWLKGEGII